MPIYYEHLAQLIAFICGLIAFKEIRPSYYRCLIPLIAITVLNEIIIVPWLTIHIPAKRDIAYNIFSLLDMSCWLYVFAYILKPSSARKAIPYATIIIFTCTFYELTLHGWFRLHIDSFRLYSITIIFFACSYLYMTLQKEYFELTKDPLFWICAGCIIYHAVLFLNFTTLSESSYWHFKNAGAVFDYLEGIGNIFYYLFLSMAFITWSRSKSRTDSCQG